MFSFARGSGAFFDVPNILILAPLLFDDLSFLLDMEVAYTMNHAVLALPVPSIAVCKSVQTMALILAMVIFTFIVCAARPFIVPKDMPLIHVPVAFIKSGSFRGINAPAMLM